MRSKGVTRDLVIRISEELREPGWMTERRLTAFERYQSLAAPGWLVSLNDIDLDQIVFPLPSPPEGQGEPPKELHKSIEQLGLSKEECFALFRVAEQVESITVQRQIQNELLEQGVLFTSLADAVREHGNLVKQYLGSVIPDHENMWTALNAALWTSGSFIWVPPDVDVVQPLQTVTRSVRNRDHLFERNLIIASERSHVWYLEGCSGRKFSDYPLFNELSEVVCLPYSRVKHTRINNWDASVTNLVIKRASVQSHASMHWVDGSAGSKRTVKFPSAYLMGEGANAEIDMVAIGSQDHELQTGARIFHQAPNTSSRVELLPLGLGRGQTKCNLRVDVADNAASSDIQFSVQGFRSTNQADLSVMPQINLRGPNIKIAQTFQLHSVTEDVQSFFRTRGINAEEDGEQMLSHLLEAFADKFPVEYFVELNRMTKS